METVFIGLGGNLGDAKETVKRAFREIKSIEGIFFPQCSSIFRTTPVSSIPQPDFYNAVCSIKTSLKPKQVLGVLQMIETKLGKVPKPKDAPRPIDLDILLFGQRSIDSVDLDIPHPRWKERLFVLAPLRELIEDVVVEGHSFNIDSLIEKVKTQHLEHVEIVPCEKCL